MTLTVLRRAEAHDLPDLLRLYACLHPNDGMMDEAHARVAWQRILASESQRVLVAAVDGRAVATCTLVLLDNLTRGVRPYALIENVVTLPAFRRQGIAGCLLAEAVAQARAAGCYKIMLMTSRSEPETLRFYRQAGFSDTDKTAFVMRL